MGIVKIKYVLRCILLLLVVILLFSMTYSVHKECGRVAKCQCGDYLSSSYYFGPLDFLNTCRSSDVLFINSSNISLFCNNRNINSDTQNKIFSGIVVNNAENVLIEGCSISNYYNGIEIINSSNVIIIHSNFSSNFASGIDIRNSSDITILNTTLNNNWDGVFIRDSHSILIENNTIQYNTIDGIHLFENAHNSEIRNNDLSFNDGHAIAPVHCSHTIEPSNIVGKGLVRYYSNDKNIYISHQDVSELILCNINNSIIEGLNITNSDFKTDGVLSIHSHNNRYRNLYFNSVRAGIYLYYSSNNKINNMTILNSDYGLRYIKNSSSNIARDISFFDTDIVIETNFSSIDNRFEDIYISKFNSEFEELVQNNSRPEILITSDLDPFLIQNSFQDEKDSIGLRILEWLYKISLLID